MSSHAPDAAQQIDRVSPSDLVTLATDRGQVPMNLGAVLILERGSGLEVGDVRATLARRLPNAPRLRRRLLRPPLGCGRPVWVDDLDFDLAKNFSAVELSPRPSSGNDPVPADDEQLLRVACGLLCTPLDRRGPLWAALWVTGLTDDRAALVLVMHHVLADGVGGLAVLAALADGCVPPDVDDFPRRQPTRRALAGTAWRERAAGMAQVPRRLRLAVQGLGELGVGSRPLRLAARTSLNRRTGRGRRLASLDVALADVVASAHRRGCTVNDIVLTAVTGALSAVLRSRGEHPNNLVISVPVSSRRADLAGELGNQTGASPLSIPVVSDPEARLRRIVELTRRRRAHARGSSAAPMGVVFRVLARLGIFQLFIDHQRLVHTFVTNVRGPETTIQLAGHPILTMVPMALTPGNVSVCFDVLSYRGRLVITVVVDPDIVPKVDACTRAVADELEGLLQRS